MHGSQLHFGFEHVVDGGIAGPVSIEGTLPQIYRRGSNPRRSPPCANMPLVPMNEWPAAVAIFYYEL